MAFAVTREPFLGSVDWWTADNSVGHNRLVEYAGFSWTAGARKHRVSRMQVRHVVERAGLVFVREPSPPERPDEALLFLGDDEHGVPLEVVASSSPTGGCV